MPSIKPLNSLGERSLNVLNKIAASKFLEKNLYKPAEENPAKFAAKMALWSALTKDALGCYYYVTQSLNNEKIPEEKRDFVAAIDLMNGILNIGLQFTIGKWIDKKSPEWFDKIVGNKLSRTNTRKISKELSGVDEIKKLNISLADIEQHLRDKEILGHAGSKSKWLKIGFSAATMLIGTQIVTKRVLVPFLSTPLASWYKEKFMDKKKKPAQKGRVYYEWKSLNPEQEKEKAAALNKVAMK